MDPTTAGFQQRLLVTAARLPDAELIKLSKTKGYANFLACTDAIRGEVGRALAVKAVLSNIDKWFTGYLGHHSVDWDARSVGLMAQHLRAIQKHYPSSVPKVAYRVTSIGNRKGLPADQLLGTQQLEEERRILSFSADPNYPRTFWSRVRGADLKEMVSNPRMFGATYPEDGRRDHAIVVYQVPVSAKNLAGTHESCALFIEAVQTYYDVWLYELIQRKPEITWKNVKTSQTILSGIQNILRPMIRRQKEVVLVFPNNKVTGEVIDVLANVPDVRRKFQKQGKL